MIETREYEANFYNEMVKKSIKDLKIHLNEYQFGNRSHWPEVIRKEHILTIKAQLWELDVSKKELEKI
ncbi:MAG: hypothetical protein ACLQG5_06885 [Methanobacterium sp.]|jgi:hypothetical protein